MLRAYTNLLFTSRPQPCAREDAPTRHRSASALVSVSRPSGVKVRDGEWTPPGRVGTPLPSLPAPKNDTLKSARDVRRAVGDTQLQRARVALQNGASAILALLSLAPEALVAGGVAHDFAHAMKIIAALQKHHVLDCHQRLNTRVTDDTVQTALRGLSLSKPECLRARDAVKVLRFLNDFGVREKANSFDSELCCGNAFLMNEGAAGNWDAFLKALYDPSHDAAVNHGLQRALVELTR